MKQIIISILLLILNIDQVLSENIQPILVPEGNCQEKQSCPEKKKNYSDKIKESQYTDFSDPLLSDYYQYEMAYSYWKNHKHDDTAVFELFFRQSAFNKEFCIFAGLEEVLSFLKYFKITDQHILLIKQTFPYMDDENFFDWLQTLNSSVIRVYAQKEGSIVFPKVPLITIEGPLGFCTLLEGPLMSLTAFPTLVASNAANMRLAIGINATLYEYGFRRAQGPGAALLASRYNFTYSYLGGFNQTSNLLAATRYGIPVSATISHAFVTSFKQINEVSEFIINNVSIKERTLYYRQLLQFDKTIESELASFIALAYSVPQHFLCIVDSFNTMQSGLPNFIIVAFALMDAGIQPVGVRLDSGNLQKISIKTRKFFKKMGNITDKDVSGLKIMGSNNIGQKELEEYSQMPHEIDIFAIESELVTCDAQPHLGIVYKLVEISGLPALKFSESVGKSTLPFKKSVYRVWVKSQSKPISDIIALPEENILEKTEIRVVSLDVSQERYIIIPTKIERLLDLVQNKGEILVNVHNLGESREYAQSQLKSFPTKQLLSKKKYLVLATEQFWQHYQKAASKILIPAILH